MKNLYLRRVSQSSIIIFSFCLNSGFCFHSLLELSGGSGVAKWTSKQSPPPDLLRGRACVLGLELQLIRTPESWTHLSRVKATVGSRGMALRGSIFSTAAVRGRESSMCQHCPASPLRRFILVMELKWENKENVSCGKVTVLRYGRPTQEI